MKLKIILSSIVLFYAVKNNYGNTLKKIELNYTLDSSYTVYENKLAVIYINNSDIINFLSVQVQKKEMCELKRKNYIELLNFLNSHNNQINYFISRTKDASKETSLPSNEKTGFAPLDFFSSLAWLEASLPYYPPYGYIPKYIDSTNFKVTDKTLYNSIINELLLIGKGKVFNKTSNSYEQIIFFEILQFPGHGGRNFLFRNKELFYNLDWFGDVGARNDKECNE